MGDVAQILAPTASSAIPNPNKAVEIAGMSKEVLDLLKGKNQDAASASLPPIVPSFVSKAPPIEQGVGEVKVKVGSKWISSSKRARPWTWAPFTSSSRTDGAMFHHWVRKNVEYTDYPYAKFDVHMDPVTYTSDEYALHLQSDNWTKGETDRLMELARIFELRWPVILDRFSLEYASGRKIEDLQHRYYGVAALLAQVRIAQEAANEARALSAAAAKSAATTPTTTTTTTTNTPPAVAAGTTPQAANPTAAAAITQQQKQQEQTDNLLLESAAARALATSAKHHQPLMAHIGTGTTNKVFDFTKEQERRQHLDRLWRRSKEEEEEEAQLRKELKTIDAQLRKLKKSGGHILAMGRNKASAAATPGRPVLANAPVSSAAAAAPRGPSRTATPIPTAAVSSATAAAAVDPTTGNNIPNNTVDNADLVESSDVLDQYFASTAPVPMPQHPYLQSGRLVPPSSGGSSGINKSLLTKMDQVLKELDIKDRPLPTKRVCDLYDTVRKDILTLVSLQKMLMQREGQLQSKRLRLSRMGGTIVGPDDKVLDEERLLGIAPPPKPSTAATATAATAKAKTTTTAKRKVANGSGAKKTTVKKTSDAKSATSGSSGTTSSATKKKTVKRKRKVEGGKSPTVPGATKAPALGSAAAKAAAAKAAAARTAAAAAVAAATAQGANVSKAATAAAVAKVIAGVPPAAPQVLLPKTETSPKAAPSTTGATGSAAKRARKS